MRSMYRPQDPNKLLERVRINLYNLVGEATASIAHLETGWSQEELTKRIVRYIFNSAKSPELLEMGRWEEVGKKLVEQAMHGYGAACQEKPWFYEIDLAPAFSVCAWDILTFRGRPRVAFEQLQEYVGLEFEDHLDRTLLNKAMWEAIEATFQDGTARTKVYNAVSRTYQAAFEDALADPRPMPDIQRIEHFMKRWVEGSMQRAWTAIENSERVVTEAKITRLFQNLIAPFGDDHPFSCIPRDLLEQIGRPPRDWPFVRTVVGQLMAHWNNEASMPPTASAAKRRKTKGGAVHVGAAEDGEEADGKEGGADEEPPFEGEGGTEGHPDCVSAEDCIGGAKEPLVRHMLNDEPGDVYCATCWSSFVGQNSNLEGVFEGGPKAGKPFCTPI